MKIGNWLEIADDTLLWVLFIGAGAIFFGATACLIAWSDVEKARAQGPLREFKVKFVEDSK